MTVNGALFWLTMEVSEKCHLEYVVSFDTGSKLLRKLQLPTSFSSFREISKKLAAYNDSVSLLVCSENERKEYLVF